MELTFNKVGKQYEAEFQLSADANLHIEFESAAPVKLYQRTTGSGWDLVNDVKNAVGKATDVDLTSLIYPKFVKVVCVQEPTYATVTTDGEITEIKAQSKEIEVTSNGTMDITPDAGFAYLNSVKVKTNVAQSGEGGASQGVKIGYYNAPKEFIIGLLGFSPIVYLVKNGNGDIAPGTALISLGDELENVNITSFAVIEPNTQYIRFSAEETPTSPNEIMETLAGAGLGAATEITESEFYNLNA